MLLQSPSVGSRFRLQQHVAFLFILLSEGCPLNRPRIEDGRGQGASVQVLPQNLVTVDVSREDCSETSGKVGTPNHVGSISECEVDGAAGGSLNTMVHTEEPEVGRVLVPACRLKDLGESVSDLTPLIRKARHGHLHAPDMVNDGSGATEDMEVGVASQSIVGNARSLMVSGHHEDRHAGFGDLNKGAERLEHEGRRHSRPMKKVAAMDHQIHFPSLGRIQGEMVVGQEVMTPPAPHDSGAHGEVEAEVGIGNE